MLFREAWESPQYQAGGMGGWERGAQPLRCTLLRVMLPWGVSTSLAASSRGWSWSWFVKNQGLTYQGDLFLFFFKLVLFKIGQKSIFCRKMGILAELGNFSSDRAGSGAVFS